MEVNDSTFGMDDCFDTEAGLGTAVNSEARGVPSVVEGGSEPAVCDVG